MRAIRLTFRCIAIIILVGITLFVFGFDFVALADKVKKTIAFAIVITKAVTWILFLYVVSRQR